jgi:hypothetical protein
MFILTDDIGKNDKKNDASSSGEGESEQLLIFVCSLCLYDGTRYGCLFIVVASFR